MTLSRSHLIPSRRDRKKKSEDNVKVYQNVFTIDRTRHLMPNMAMMKLFSIPFLLTRLENFAQSLCHRACV